MPGELLEYYLRACKWPQVSVFHFEEDYTREFIEDFGYGPVENNGWREVLDEVIDDSQLEEQDRLFEEYKSKLGDASAVFEFCFQGYSGIRGWHLKVVAKSDEDPSVVVDRFLKTLEFISGIRVSKDRVVFTWPGKPKNSPVSDADVISQATKKRVSVGIIPRPGHPRSDPWDFDDVVPTMMRYVWKNDGYLSLHYRFRIWTVIWGTGQVLRKLVEANPDLIEKARSLGIRDYVLDDVLNAPIPASPISEPIPLEILESTLLLKAIISYMYDNYMINNDAGYCLIMDGSKGRRLNMPTSNA